jgi:glyoxylase-like metal-dependent hydrolase (beta-lactamase superfamily II)
VVAPTPQREGGATSRVFDVMAMPPDVYEIPLTRVKVDLILEPDLSLIDTGYRGSRSRIARAIAGHGRSIDDLARVICTHGHPDHAGAARAFGQAGANIYMHPADAAALATGWREAIRHPSRGRIFAAMTPQLEAFIPIVDGDVLPVLGGLEVVHTPGHTPGSICLYGARDRVLFVGDALQRRFGRVTYASGLYSDDHSAAKRAAKRLAALDVETIVFSHYPALREGVARTLAALAGDVAD